MIAPSWIGGGLAAALAITTALLLSGNHHFVEQVRARIGGSHSSDTEYQSDLLADAFKGAANRERPYHRVRRGELVFNKQMGPII